MEQYLAGLSIREELEHRSRDAMFSGFHTDTWDSNDHNRKEQVNMKDCIYVPASRNIAII